MTITIPTKRQVREANLALAKLGPIPLAWIVDEVAEVRETLDQLEDLPVSRFDKNKTIFTYALGLGMAIGEGRKTDD